MGKVASGASRIGFWRYEKDRERSSQVCRLRKHPIHRYAVPLPQWGRLRYEDAAFLDTTPSTRGKVASEASRIGFWRYEREWGNASQVDDKREHPIHRWRGPPSPMGKAAIRGCRYPHIVKANTGICGENNTDGQSLPRVGKAIKLRKSLAT